jgi:hypothetical protein
VSAVTAIEVIVYDAAVTLEALPLGGVPGATQSLAIDGNVFQAQSLSQGFDPLAKTGLEGLRVQAVEDPLQGIVGGQAVG